MRIDTRPDGSQIMIPEAGDLVRLTRDEPGPEPTALRGEWGRIVRITPRKNLDIQLAGYSRPRSAPMATVRDILPINVEPCDAKGLPKPLPSLSEGKPGSPNRSRGVL